ncbi:magnesium-translocating P-type ATPase [Noviherbaspirillum galbum]|nr:magnesium-translocating P-type ATPase [Noviherbaspirillum galbum]
MSGMQEGVALPDRSPTGPAEATPEARADRLESLENFWARPADELADLLGSGKDGLSGDEARRRLLRAGPNDTGTARVPGLATLVLRHFSNPLLLILLFAAVVSMTMREWTDAIIVILILAASAVLSIYQEHRASQAVARLRRRLTVSSVVLRDGSACQLPATEIVPGDVILLSAGNQIPADGVVLDATDLFVDQALLSGETWLAEKHPGVSPAHAPLASRGNCVFMGTSVRSGTGRMLAVNTGRHTEFGLIEGQLERQEPETEFERGLRRFGAMLMRFMFLIVLVVLGINILLQRASGDTLLFVVALAVGLSPELLPAILTVTLAHGSKEMARQGVIVKRLNAIENLGSMTVLCTDKTGTLTAGAPRLDAAVDVSARPDEELGRLAFLNASLQTGLANALDQAILASPSQRLAPGTWRKLDEIPYDFQRRRLSVVVAGSEGGESALMITKGAFQNVMDVCASAWQDGAEVPLDESMRSLMSERFAAWSAQGFRVLGLATRRVDPGIRHSPADERNLCLRGFLLFFDPPEPGVKPTLASLHRLGVTLKIITGDNLAVARHVAEAVGIDASHALTGEALSAMSDDALWQRAAGCNLFAEVDPNQKERIVRVLQKGGQVVGFLGDGINDAPALHAADVGISVDRAVDVAREAADLVLLKHDLKLVRAGIDEGRHTFANTLKYIFITTSANFGNMISMAVAALALPFLPLLAKQILLNNFLSDIPALGIAGDNVDREWDRTPHRWDLNMIRSFMLSFGLISTAFDLVTFGALLWLTRNVAAMDDQAALFRTGWFVESLLTQLFILMVIRTYKPIHRSRPAGFVAGAVLAIAGLALALPYLPVAQQAFSFVPLPWHMVAAILLITAAYIIVSELTKRHFYRRFGFGIRRRRAVKGESA